MDMLYNLTYRPLPLGDIKGQSDITKLKKNIFDQVDKTLHFGCLKVCYKEINFGVNQCTSGHVISQNMEFMRLAISLFFFKIETSGLDQTIL